MTDEQMAELAKRNEIDAWLLTARMLVDEQFAAWAAEVAYEEHEAHEYSLMCAELAHGLG